MNFALDEKTDGTAESGEIAPDHIGIYLKNRRSVRHYAPKNVEKEKIKRILDIVRYAPSGTNSQPVQWLVVYDKKRVAQLAELTIDWMRYLSGSENPLNAYAARLVAAWERGIDPICWAGFLAGAARTWKPMQEEIALPKGRVAAYAMLFGYPRYKIYRIPRRNPVKMISAYRPGLKISPATILDLTRPI